MKATKFLVILCVFLLGVSFALGDDSADEDQNDEELGEGGEEEEEEEVDDDLNIEEENNVLVLKTHNFDKVVNSHEIILVEFYAPWCGHCKSLAPVYEKAAKTLKENDPPVALAKVDATIEPELGKKYAVSGYPTLKFFKNGIINDYDGPRDEFGIVDYMKEKADPNWTPPASEVVVLTKDNFEEFVNKDLSLVEFYAPWCGHCKQLAPEFEKAALYVKDHGVGFGKVDATVENDLATQFGVEGYPTLYIFRNGKKYEYKGSRSKAHEIADYMREQIGSATKEQKSLKDLQKALSKDDVTVVGFFNSADDKEYTIYESFTNNVREDYKLVHTMDTAARDNYKVNAGSVVVFVPERFQSKYESKWYIKALKEDTAEDDIVKFVKSHELPLTGQMTEENKNTRYIKEGHKPIVLFFYDVDWSFDHRVATEQTRKKALRIAKDYKEDFIFAVTDENESADLFKNLGFDDSSEDLNVAILSSGGGKYPMEPMEDGFEDDLVREFLNKFKEGELKPKLKSQRPPKKQGLVTVVVGETFEKIVLDKKKDVLIEFYAPWCGHCKSLEPKYKDLAKKLKKEKNLIIAKFDATANESPEQFAVSGYPTIYFASADHKSDPIQYSGANEVADLTKFIKENAKASFQSGKEEL